MEEHKKQVELIYHLIAHALMIAPKTRFAVWEEEVEDEEGNVSIKKYDLTLSEFVTRAIGEQMIDEFGSITNQVYKEALEYYDATEGEIPTGHPFTVRFVGMMGRGRRTRRKRNSN